MVETPGVDPKACVYLDDIESIRSRRTKWA